MEAGGQSEGAKKYSWSLEVGKGKETSSLLQTSVGIHPWQYLAFRFLASRFLK